MGRYKARDVVGVPGLLSLSRVPLAATFPFVVERPAFALGVLVASGLTDVADGWYARRFGQVTATGAALDPVTDKIFVLTVAATLLVTGQLTMTSVLLLSTREIGELPLVVWLACSPRARAARTEQPSANVAGKAATALQFASVGVALFGDSHAPVWVDATAVVGVVAAVSYWWRALAIRGRRSSGVREGHARRGG